MPRISVLFPVWNSMPHLAATLASISRQTERDWELVAVDDGSEDDSAEALERAARRDSRVRVIRMPHRGLPSALATALEHASGPLLARHDADDLSHRDRLRLQLEVLQAREQVSVVASRVRLFPTARITPAMKRWALWQNGLLDHESLAREALVDATLLHGTALFRREWVERAGGWRDCDWPEDVDLTLRLLRCGARFLKLPRALYGWRQHPRSATRHDPRYGAERFSALRLAALAEDFLAPGARPALIGVGRSLEAWRARLASLGIPSRAIEAARPGSGPSPEPPAVLVFGAPPARERWRVHLNSFGWIERRDFIFVS